jgi:hypothetical protein
MNYMGMLHDVLVAFDEMAWKYNEYKILEDRSAQGMWGGLKVQRV